MEAARDDPAVRAIVVTGAGEGFCAGADMAALGEIGARGENEARPFTPPDPTARIDFQHPMTWLPAIPKPVIAAINGPVAGMGLAIVLFCDLRFASESALFVSAFSRRGLIAEHGTSWMLSRLVGHSRALDIMLSSRRVGAEEAYRIGLADRLCAPEQLLDEAHAYARELADAVSPRSTRIIKRQLWDALLVDLAESMADADREMALSLKSADFREGVAHFVEKRGPHFTGE
jgi:enoyl-CoA hydratase/carnithine racemase